MSNFPGIRYQTIGGIYKPVIVGATTERVTIIGTAVDGPLNAPTPVNDSLSFARQFGPANYSRGYKDPVTSTESGNPNGASLPLAVSEALKAGCTDVWAVRATGNTAKATYNAVLDIRAAAPGRIYNGLTVTFSTDANKKLNFTIAQPFVKGGTIGPVAVPSSAYTVDQTIGYINQYTGNNSIFIERSTYGSALALPAWSTIPSGTATLAGGTNGTRSQGDDYGPESANGVNGYATALTTADTGTFDTLYSQGFRSHMFVLADLYVDDQITNGGGATSTSIVIDFASFLDTVSTNLGPCHGIMTVRPPHYSNPADIISWVNGNLLATTPAYWDQSQRWICAGPFLYNTGTAMVRVDNVEGTVYLGKYIQVLAGPEVALSHPDIGRYTTIPASLYAGMLSNLPPERAPIFSPLPNVEAIGTGIPLKYAKALVDGLGYDPTQDLSGQGAYVVFTRSPRDGSLVVAKDCTIAPRNDYFNENQVVRVTQSIHNALADSLFGFLGQTLTEPLRVAIDTRITSVLEGYAASGALTGSKGVGYNFVTEQVGNDSALGLLRLRLELNLASVLTTIVQSVTVRKN